MSSPFSLVSAHSALLVVDMQRYLTQPDYPFCRLSGARVEGGIASYFERLDTTVIPNLRVLCEAFRQNTSPVWYTMLGSYTANGSDLPSWARRINESGRTMFCSAVIPCFGDPSAEIDPRIAPEPGDRIVRKTTTGALASSPLETELCAFGVSSVVVTGVLTPLCVTQTARELADRNFDVAIVDDATTSLTETAHSAALAAFAAIYGWVVTTRDIVAILDRPLR